VTNLSIRVHAFISGLLHREEGQDMIEYALFGGLLATAIITIAGLIVAGTIPNPVQGLLDGLEGCIDFDQGTACDPF